MTVRVEPLRDLILVALRPIPDKTGSIIRVSHFTPARWANVLAVGPEVRDVSVGMGVLVNPLIGTVIEGGLLYPEGSILATE